MSAASDKRTITIVTACMTASGTPTFVLTEVDATPEEIENGIHYYLAEAQLLDGGYEEPMVHFDEGETPAFLHAAVRQQLHLSPAADVPTILTFPKEPRCPA